MQPERGACGGCGRTLQEIADWSELDSDQRLRVRWR